MVGHPGKLRRCGITEIVCGVRLYLETHEFHNYSIMSQKSVPVCACCVYLCSRPSVCPSVRPSVFTRRLRSAPTFVPCALWWEGKVRSRGTGDCVIPSLSESHRLLFSCFYFFLGLRAHAPHAREFASSAQGDPGPPILRKHYFAAIIARRVLAYH